MRYTNPIFAICILILGIQFVTPTLADNTGSIPEISATQETPATSVFGEVVSDADLSSYRGGSALQISEMNLDSKLLNNQAIANVTGSNFVTQDAFSGASGFSTVVQNSGNNVIIQNATIVNLSLH